MKTLDRLILKSYAGPMVLTFFIVAFILLMQFIWLYIDELVGKGLGVAFIAEMMFWVSLTTIPMALPLSTLLASIMTMGNLGENNELLAMKSAGISLQRIMRPLMILVFIVSLLAFYVSNSILPLASLKMQTMLRDMRQKRPDVALVPGVFSTDITGYAIKIDGKDPKTNMMKGVMIYDHTAHKGNVSVTFADSGYINITKDGRYVMLTLFSGNTYQDDQNAGMGYGGENPFSRWEFERQEFLIEMAEWNRTDEEMYKGTSKTLSIVGLSKSIDSLQQAQKVQVERAVTYYVGTSSLGEVRVSDSLSQQPHISDIPAVNIDSIFNGYSTEQKYAVLLQAKAAAEQSKSQIEFTRNELEQQRKTIAQSKVDYHTKFTLSVACLVFFFIGAPLGAIIRKGGLGMPMVVSLFLFVIYWVMYSAGQKVAVQGTWNAAIATWYPSVVLLPLGVFLTYKATTDSALFNIDQYFAWFKRFFARFKRNKKT